MRDGDRLSGPRVTPCPLLPAGMGGMFGGMPGRPSVPRMPAGEGTRTDVEPSSPDVRHGDPGAHAASLSAIGHDAAVLMSIQAPMDEARKRALMPGIPEVGVQGVVGPA